MTGLLLAVGFFTVLGFEWDNAGTLGPLDPAGKLLAAFFQGVQPRTAGFNTLDYGADGRRDPAVPGRAHVHRRRQRLDRGRHQGGDVRPAPAHGLDGDPGRPGGQRVRPPDRRRRQRQASGCNPDRARWRSPLCTLVLVSVSDARVSQSIFESASAFGTVGLSTGITGGLPTAGQVALSCSCTSGRVGPHAIGTALVAARAPSPLPLRGGTADHRLGFGWPGSSSFLVIGLGRFGGALAETLVALGHEVLGVDPEREGRPGATRRELTHVVEATRPIRGDGAARAPSSGPRSSRSEPTWRRAS